MKTLRINQCEIGKFNWLSEEESLSFSMSILEDGKQYEEVGVKALLHYNGSTDNYDVFKNALENLEEVFDLCYKDSCKWIGSNNYEECAILFAKVYKEHYEEINSNALKDLQEKIQKEIENLQKKLSYSDGVPDLSDQIYYTFGSKIKENKNMLESYDKDLADLKEGSESYLKKREYRDKYADKIEKLQAIINIEATDEL